MNWYAFYTRPRCELKAFDFFTKLGVESYVPLRMVERQWSDRKKKLRVPAIASYIFVAQETLQLDLLNENPFTTSLVRYLGMPARMSASAISLMRRYLDGKHSCEIQLQTFLPGQKLRVDSGLMLGKEGVVQQQRGQKVIVLLESLGVQLTIHLGSTAVKALS